MVGKVFIFLHRTQQKGRLLDCIHLLLQIYLILQQLRQYFCLSICCLLGLYISCLYFLRTSFAILQRISLNSHDSIISLGVRCFSYCFYANFQGVILRFLSDQWKYSNQRFDYSGFAKFIVLNQISSEAPQRITLTFHVH